MGQMELRQFLQQGNQACIELWMDGEPLGHILLDAVALDAHIRKLSDLRSAMSQDVSLTTAAGRPPSPILYRGLPIGAVTIGAWTSLTHAGMAPAGARLADTAKAD